MRLAHLADPHLLEPRNLRSTSHATTMRFTSLGRRLDPDLRASRLAGALAKARNGCADHVVIAGDLTEMGTAAQFERLAELLAASGLPADAITLLPGNHDAYADVNGWTHALDGPLAPWARTSPRDGAAIVIEREGLDLVAVDTAVHQSFALSGGVLRNDALECVTRFAADRARAGRPVVVALHHPPYHYQMPILRGLDSLQGGAALLAMMDEQSHVAALHGHLHRDIDRPLPASAVDGPARVFCARAAMKGEDAVRFYEARGPRLEPWAAP